MKAKIINIGNGLLRVQLEGIPTTHSLEEYNVPHNLRKVDTLLDIFTNVVAGKAKYIVVERKE